MKHRLPISIKPYSRFDKNDDEIFYHLPRFDSFIDTPAQKALTDFYFRTLPVEGKILDLMAGRHSYLPQKFSFDEVVGLGLNEIEMKENTQLDKYVVHNLNKESTLPFGNSYFDACILSLSIQYLTHPVKVMKDIARVLKPNSPVAVVFSDRMFPTKAISIWRSGNVAGRTRYIKSCVYHSGLFHRINFEDLSPAYGASDSIYVVSACRKKNSDLFGRAGAQLNYVTRRAFLTIIGAMLASSIFFVKKASAKSITERVKLIISDQLGVDLEKILPETHIVDDLGADSLDTVELIMSIEEEFNISISDKDMEKIETVKDIIDYITRLSG
ncbi:MAG: acyl carrier protein [Deltaproteobacteria bacterium]|nr:acyl carrier protein [Deltaproteobacteria bacterium]